jgi:uncharacterized iron-regulated protein
VHDVFEYYDAKHWRDRATEMRALAAEMKDAVARKMMLGLASDYDKLGDRAEERAKTSVNIHNPTENRVV